MKSRQLKSTCLWRKSHQPCMTGEENLMLRDYSRLQAAVRLCHCFGLLKGINLFAAKWCILAVVRFEITIRVDLFYKPCLVA
jgi:hypothetical protein